MPHIVVAGILHPSGLALLAATKGVSFGQVEEISEPSYQPYLAKADALVIRTQPLTAASITLAANLKIVSRHGVAYDAVDVAALNARNIPLCIVGEVNAVSVAEHAMLLILACAKHLIRADSAVRSGNWNWRNGLDAGELSGKHLLIAGYGRIGRHLAHLAAAFGMQVQAVDPYPAAQGWPAGPVTPTTLATGLSWADVVSIHAPKGIEALIGASELALVKPGIILINTARGGIIDEMRSPMPCRMVASLLPVWTCLTKNRLPRPLAARL